MDKNMHKDINNIEKDVFSEALRNKLEHHSLPVDAGAWDAIRAGVKAQKRKKMIPFWWTSAGAAAVILLLLSLQFFNNTSDIESQLAVNKTIETKTDIENIKENIEETTEIENTKPIKTLNSSKSFLKKINAKASLANRINTVIGEKNNETLVDLIAVISTSTDSMVLSDKVLIAEKESKGKKAEDKGDIANTLKTDEFDVSKDWEDPLKIDDNKEWALLASVSSSGGIDNNNFLTPTSSAPNQFASIVRAPRQRANTTIMAPSDFAVKTFQAPLSVGFAAMKKINNGFSIQTGLVYTYLLTDFMSSNSTAKLNLHYLGIPLNVNLQLWENSKWSVYASAGAMIEKGLKSDYVQVVYAGNQTIKTIVSTKIDGLQWSIQAASGITYNFYREFDFYFEPKLSYSFDNNQPISIRTDKNIAIGLEAGVRFRF